MVCHAIDRMYRGSNSQTNNLFGIFPKYILGRRCEFDSIIDKSNGVSSQGEWVWWRICGSGCWAGGGGWEGEVGKVERR